MSNFDVFDNLNSYLDKTDDYDISDDADLGASFDEEAAELQVPAATAKGKRGIKKDKEPKLISPKKKRDKPTSLTSLHSAMSQEEEEENDGDDDLESGSGSQSSIASRKKGAEVDVVEVEDDELEQQIAAIKKQYDIIFNQNKSFADSNKKFFSGLKRRYTTLAKQFHSRSRNKTFPQKLQLLRDEMYDICVNSNLFAPAVPAAPVPVAPAPVITDPQLPATRSGTRRSLRGRRDEPELINLVDSPALILPGVVNLDSDGDEDCVMAVNEVDQSFDSENYELSLKIKWEGKIERFAHRKHQKFADLIGQLAKRAGSDPSHVVLDINERIINPEDTPDSINYRISQFISGRVMQGKLAELFVGSRPNASKAAVNKNLIKLKVQSDRWKQPLEIQIEKDRKMKLVVIKCAEQLKCAPSEFKLSFDGDPVELDSTPLDLDLEGGEILDLRFVK